MDFNKELQDELNELSPSLSKLDKREGFEVPPRYFDRLTDEVLRKAKADTELTKEKQSPQWLQNISNALATLWQPRVAISLASVAVLVLAVNFFFNTSSDIDDPLAGISDISDQELSQYIQENLDEFDADLLADLGDDFFGDYFLPLNEDELLDQYFEKAIDEIDPDDLEELL